MREATFKVISVAAILQDDFGATQLQLTYTDLSGEQNGRLKNAAGIGLPHKEGYMRFVPDARWNPERSIQRGPQGGFVDRHGNEWKPDFVKGEWGVQLGRTGQRQLGHLSKNGRYLNVTPDGRISH